MPIPIIKPPMTSQTAPEKNPEKTASGGATARNIQRKKKMSALRNSGITAVANNPIVSITMPAVRITKGSTPMGGGRKTIVIPAKAPAQARQFVIFKIFA
jgi:hypothetical protein